MSFSSVKHRQDHRTGIEPQKYSVRAQTAEIEEKVHVATVKKLFICLFLE